MNLNKAELIGNLAADPVAKTLPSSAVFAAFTVATSYRWRSIKTKEPMSETQYHTVLAFGRLGQVVLKYLKKGDRVYVDGHLRNSRGKTEIIAVNLIMLGAAKSVKQQIVNDEVIVEESDPENSHPLIF